MFQWYYVCTQRVGKIITYVHVCMYMVGAIRITHYTTHNTHMYVDIANESKTGKNSKTGRGEGDNLLP